jgi:hypothetical protein
MQKWVQLALLAGLFAVCITARAQCVPQPNEVAVFVDSDFQGACKILPVGDYPTATSTGLPNDSISSIRIGAGAQVTVCVDEYYAGSCAVLTQNTPDMGATPVGNDNMTSAKVRTLGTSDFDPRCGNPHATGRFTCRIDQPDVRRAEAVYSNVVFMPKDTVYVDGDGCVQTGSHFWSGATWKRYVNPSGSNSDHQYHGLVRVPGGHQAGTDVGNTLTRIEHVVGRPIQIVATDAPTGGFPLHLGYEDDDYGDNTYIEHDDGTEDQCKTQDSNYGGPAFVTITICRGVAHCEAPASRFPFNIRSDDFDPNGFLFNPHWAWQERPENQAQSPVPTPKTSLCHGFVKDGPLLGLHSYQEPNLPDCTDQAGSDTLNQPSDLSANNIVCTALAIPTSLGFSGHINWFPITIMGQVERISHEFQDDDWDFSLIYDAPKGMLYYDHVNEKPRTLVHSEFDSDETVDNFKSKAWSDLHAAINERESISDQLHSCLSKNILDPAACAALQMASNTAWDRADQLFIGPAIVSGLFGIDGEHGEKSELHPVYAFASNPCVNATFKDHKCEGPNLPSDDVWLMFVRNRGDEGGCSSDIWNAGFDDYIFQLPWRPGMKSATVDWDKTQFDWSDGSSARPDISIVPPLFTSESVPLAHSARRAATDLFKPAGIYVTFHLREPTVLPASDSSASVPFVDGALHLIWTPLDTGPGSTASGGITANAGVAIARMSADSAEDDDDEQDSVEIALRHLPDAQRKQVLQARVALSPHVQTRPRSHSNATLKAKPAAIVTGSGAHSPVAGPAGFAGRKNMRDAALLKSLCTASDNKPFGLPTAVCNAKPQH